jgi:hypothetical protein
VIYFLPGLLEYGINLLAPIFSFYLTCIFSRHHSLINSTYEIPFDLAILLSALASSGSKWILISVIGSKTGSFTSSKWSSKSEKEEKEGQVIYFLTGFLGYGINLPDPIFFQPVNQPEPGLTGCFFIDLVNSTPCKRLIGFLSVLGI